MRYLILLVTFFTLSALFVLSAAEPVVATPAEEAQHALDNTNLHRKFYDWALVESFQRIPGQQPWRKDAEQFFTELAQLIATKEGTADLPTIGKKLLAAGCDDPLVQLRVGIFLENEPEGKQLLAKAIPALRKRLGSPNAYPALHLISALRRQVNGRNHKLKPEVENELINLIPIAFQEALAVAPGGREISIDNLVIWVDPLMESEGLSSNGITQLFAALDKSGCDTVLVDILRARRAIVDAWNARGGGYANTVTPAGWDGYSKGLEEARRRLTKAWEQLPQSATAPSMMIRVAMGDGKGDESIWFDRALKADPGCEDAWGNMSYAMVPRWGGSTDKMLAVAHRALSYARPENRIGKAANMAIMAFCLESDDEATAWGEIAKLDKNCPLPAGPLQQFRVMGVAWSAGNREKSFEIYKGLSGLAIAGEVLRAAPFGLARAAGLVCKIERARLGLPEPQPRPLPENGAQHLKKNNAPTCYDFLVTFWEAHGKHDPVWDDRIRKALEQAATSAESCAELVSTGCTDPLVCFIAGQSKLMQNSENERQAYFLKYWNELEAAHYPPIVVWQPAWNYIREIYNDKSLAKRRAQPTARYKELAERLALSIGSEGVTGGMVLYELSEPPKNDPDLFAVHDDIAKIAGLNPAVASGIIGISIFNRNLPRKSRQDFNPMDMWETIAPMWTAWNAYHHPHTAAKISTAMYLLGLRREARCWFDESVRLAYDSGIPWVAMIDAYSFNGEPDELLAFGEEISTLPASFGANKFAITAIGSVLRNSSLLSNERVQRAWAIINRVTTDILADAKTTDSERIAFLYWRITGAALAKDMEAVTAAVKSLGQPFDQKLLPPGINQARILAVVNPQQPEKAGNANDF